ncbi:MAG TPA: sensor histidine kinase [Opitutaceae bacterium]|nr:sensor histidine kinase [Opitutaceae bacterium]
MTSPATVSSTSVLLEDNQQRERAKARVYVFCQTGGWMFFLALQIFFFFTFPSKERGSLEERVCGVAMLVFIITLGWAITHYTRPLMARWGWKTLGWRGLAPRILAIAAAQSALWSLIGYLYPYVVLQLPWTSRLPIPAAMALSWVNGVIMLTGWLCVYFFYHLFDRYNRLQIEQLRLATHAKESELRALKSQVNPHFIFNSLNSLRALIDEQPDRARQAVTQLANLLRYSLQSGSLETVPFEDELRIVNDYLALEQVRHEERLRVRLDIAPETLTLPIPPMLLQTLVENAVKYGISTRPEGGEISILARRENDALRLQVSNPGELASAARAASSNTSTGLGLRNAAERLRLLFGDRASLQLRAGTPEIVIAEAILPLPSARA